MLRSEAQVADVALIRFQHLDSDWPATQDAQKVTAPAGVDFWANLVAWPAFLFFLFLSLGAQVSLYLLGAPRQKKRKEKCGRVNNFIRNCTLRVTRPPISSLVFSLSRRLGRSEKREKRNLLYTTSSFPFLCFARISV